MDNLRINLKIGRNNLQQATSSSIPWRQLAGARKISAEKLLIAIPRSTNPTSTCADCKGCILRPQLIFCKVSYFERSH